MKRDSIDLAAEARADFAADVALEKAEHEQRLQARSEELADARYDEDYECMMYPRPNRYALDCGCVWERGFGWTKECEAHE